MASHVVEGTLTHRKQIPLKGARVVAYDRVAVAPGRVLGETTTDAAGRYAIEYDVEAIWKSGRKGAALVVAASLGKGESVESAVQYAAPKVVQIDLHLSIADARDRATQISDTLRAVVPEVELTKLTPDETSNLAVSAEVSHNELTAFIRALRDEKRIRLPHDVLFDLHNAGTFDAARRVDADALGLMRDALKDHRDKDAHAEAALASIAHAWLDSPDTAPRLARALIETTSDKGGRNERVQLYFEPHKNDGALLEQLRKKEGDAAVREVERMLDLVDLAENDWDVAKQLRARVKAPKDVARLDRRELAELVLKSGGSKDTADARARAILARAERRYPTAAITHRIASGQGALGERQELRTFFADANIEELATAKELPPEARRVQRLFRVTSNFAELDYLYSRGFGGTEQIISTGSRASFMRAHAGGLGGADSAGATFDRASSLAGLATAVLVQNAPDFRAPPTRAIEPNTPVDIGEREPGANPFDNAGRCICCACLSVFSPSAYLFDLLLYVRRDQNGALFDQLILRWPELTSLQLSCRNIDQLVPQLDLVNELLESMIARDAGRNVAAIAETRGTLEDRRAHPQRIVDSVYATELINARYPFALPFDLFTEEMRAYPTAWKSSRLELMEAAIGSRNNALLSPAIAHEHLGLTHAAALRVTAIGHNNADWGLSPFVIPSNDMASLARRTQSELEELFQVLECRFVSGSNQAIQISNRDACVPADMVAALDVSQTIRLHRFLRLMRALGLEPHALDRILVSLGALERPGPANRPMTDAFLIRISQVKRIAEELALDFVTIASWFATRRDTHLYGELAASRVVQGGHELAFVANQGSHVASVPLPLTTAFTIVAELTIDLLGQPDLPISAQIGPNASVSWMLSVGPAGELRAVVGDAASVVQTAHPVIVAGRRTRIALRYDGSAAVGARVRFFVNGSEEPRVSNAVPVPAVLPPGGVARIGDPQKSFDGHMRYFAVVDRALSGADLARLHEEDTPAQLAAELGLAQLFVFDEGTPRNHPAIFDRSGHRRDGHLLGHFAPVYAPIAARERSYATLAALSRRSTLAPYYDLYFDRSEASGDAPRFPLEPGAFVAPLGSIAGQRTRIASLLGVAMGELDTLVELAFHDLAARVSLSHENLTILAAHAELRRALSLAVEDYRTLLACMARNVFASPLDTLEVIDAAREIERSGFSYEELAELLLATDPPHGSPRDQRHRAILLDVMESVHKAPASIGPDIVVRDKLAATLELDVDTTARLLTSIWQPGQEGIKAAGEAFLALVQLPVDPPPAELDLLPARSSLIRLEKTAALIKRFELDLPEVRWLFDVAGADALRALPIAPASSTAGLAAFAGWRRLYRVSTLRKYFARSEGKFIDLLLRTATLTETQFFDALFERTGWQRTAVESVRGRLLRHDATRRNAAADYLVYPDDFRDERGLYAVSVVAELARRIGAMPSIVMDWGLSIVPTAAEATAVKQAARSAEGEESWFERARKIRDPLRRKQRDALVAYALANPPIWAAGRPWATTFDLFEALLADVEVDTPVETSRIVFAHGTLQTYIQRLLMNLEPGFSMDPATAREWEWRKNYRVWEAARKIFIYPENWILPELKPKKTHLFDELEATLQDGDFDAKGAEASISRYMEGLETIAGLEVISAFHERYSSPPDGFPPAGIVHLVARSRSKPQAYFYCRRIEDRFSTWELVDLDIESDQVVACVARGRLFLFWARQRIGETLERTPPHQRVTVQLLVAEYRDRRWIRGKLSAESEIRDDDLPLAWDARGARLVARAGGDQISIDVFSIFGLDGQRFTIDSRTRFHYSVVTGAFRVETTPAVSALAQLGAIGLPEGQIIGTYATGLYHPSGAQTPLLQTGSDFRLGFESSQLVTAGSNPRVNIALLPFVGEQFFVHDTRNTLAVKPIQNTGTATYDDYQYDFALLSHPQIRRLREVATQQGLFAAYALELQRNPASAGPLVDFAAYTPSAHVGISPDENLVFSELSPFGEYNWELLFYAPLAIASRLRQAQRFDVAQKWMHLVFDPTVGGASASPERFWRFLPINAIIANPGDHDLLAILTSRGVSALSPQQRAQLQAQLDAWLEDPFSPHVIARMRLSAYQRAVFMQYLDLLIEWADERFQRNDRESIQEAVQLYVLAAQLLGPREPILGTCAENLSAGSFDEIAGAGNFGFHRTLEDQVPRLPRREGLDIRASLELGRVFEMVRARSVFCVPPNDKLLRYWDIIEDRLFKIRHALNFAGVYDPLPLFAPPIDPALLVRARAQGLLLDEIIGARPRLTLDRRFETLMRFALELSGLARAYGQQLATALDRRDAEALGQLRLEQEVELAKSARTTKSEHLKENKAVLRSILSAIEQARARQGYYAKRPFMNEAEKRELELMDTARSTEKTAALMSLIARVLYLVPELTAGFPPEITFGGQNLGGATEMVADGMRDRAASYRHTAGRAGRQGSFEQRADENRLQAELARRDVERLERDLTAAEIRVAIAEHELEVHDEDIAQKKEMMEELREKFTNRELYQWMSTHASRVYLQSFDLALDLARAAEDAYRFETQDQDTFFIDPGYWDGFRKGLFAAERLEHDLRRMQLEYLRNTPREYRIVKHISLAAIAPDALLALRVDGDAHFSVLEELFDRDFPGHHFRRIRRVGITIPVVAGPHASVCSTLTLEESWLRASDDPADALVYQTGPESIVTSAGQNDGMDDERNERDGRRAPFEGRGAISRWRLQMGRSPAAFPLSSIPDVILHVTYTSRQANDALRVAAENRLAIAPPGVETRMYNGAPAPIAVPQGARPVGRLIVSARSRHPDAWLRFIGGDGTQQTSLEVEWDVELFGAELRSATIHLRTLAFIFVLSEDRTYGPPLLQADVRAPGEAQRTPVPIAEVSNVPVAMHGGLDARIDSGPIELRMNHAELTALSPQDLIILCTYDVR